MEDASVEIKDSDGFRELIFNPPLHGSGEFSISVTITDLEIVQEAVIIFNINEVEEPPVISLEEEFFDENPEVNQDYQVSSDSQNFVFFHKEGQMLIARFRAEDLLINILLKQTILNGKLIHLQTLNILRQE